MLILKESKAITINDTFHPPTSKNLENHSKKVTDLDQ